MTDDYILAQHTLQDIRLRIINKQEVSAAEMRANLIDLRRGREATAAAAAKSKRAEGATRRRAEAVPLNLNSLFSEEQTQ